MPLPPLVILAVVSGLAASVAGRHELRQSPRPILLTRSFVSYAGFATLVLVPSSAYFYVFHGDWFLLYLFDVEGIPSAVALLGFVAQAALGMLSFVLGALLVRAQREIVVAVLLALLAVGGALLVFLYLDRLAQVGTYAQFHGQFGLEPFEDGPLLTGALAMGGLMSTGLLFLLLRLWRAGRAR